MLSGIPLPKVVADTGPGGNIVTGQLGANALTRSNLENQYYGPSQQADIALKQIQARYMPAQLIGQVLSNPALASVLPKEAIQNLAKQYSNALNNPVSTQGYGEPSSNGTFGKQALNWLANKIMGSGANGANGANSTGAPTNALSQMPNNSMDNGAGTGSDVATPQQVQQIADNGNNSTGSNIPSNAYPSDALPSSTINQAQSQLGVPGSAGGENPVAISNAQSAALDTMATSEASAQQNSWKEIGDSGNKAANDAQNNINVLQKMKSTYDQLGWWEKGFPFGTYSPAMTSAAQNLDSFSNSLANQVASQNVQGHVTDQARSAYLAIKPNRGMNKEAFNDNINYATGMNKRLLELPAFNNAAQRANLTPAQRSAVWTYYNNQQPFYSQDKDGRTIVAEDNLNDWPDYLSKENIKKSLSGNEGKKPNNQGSSKMQLDDNKNMWPANKAAINQNILEGQASPTDTQWWIRPDGMQVPVHKSQVETAKKLNYRKVG